MNEADSFSRGIGRCREKSEASKLAVISLGNPLRGDDGIAASVCASLPQGLLDSIQFIDLGIHTNLLQDCIQGHQAILIVDSTANGTAPGTISILNLSKILERPRPFSVNSCHGLSLSDELRLAQTIATLPKFVMFFGIEGCETTYKHGLSDVLKRRVPRLRQHLSILINEMLAMLNEEAQSRAS